MKFISQPKDNEILEILVNIRFTAIKSRYKIKILLSLLFNTVLEN